MNPCRHTRQPGTTQNYTAGIELLYRFKTCLGQYRVGGNRVARQLGAALRHGQNACQVPAKTQVLGEPLQHWLPAHATCHDGEAPCFRGLDKRGFGQTGDGRGTAFAQRHEAGVAKTANQHPVKPFSLLCPRPGPGIEHGVAGNGITGLTGNVRRAEAGRIGVYVYQWPSGHLGMAVQERRDTRGGVGVDEQEVSHGKWAQNSDGGNDGQLARPVYAIGRKAAVKRATLCEPHHADSDSATDAFACGEIFVNMGVNNRVNFELKNRLTRNFEP